MRGHSAKINFFKSGVDIFCIVHFLWAGRCSKMIVIFFLHYVLLDFPTIIQLSINNDNAHLMQFIIEITNNMGKWYLMINYTSILLVKRSLIISWKFVIFTSR